MAAHDCEPNIQEAKAQGYIPGTPSSQATVLQSSKEIHACLWPCGPSYSIPGEQLSCQPSPGSPPVQIGAKGKFPVVPVLDLLHCLVPRVT